MTWKIVQLNKFTFVSLQNFTYFSEWWPVWCFVWPALDDLFAWEVVDYAWNLCLLACTNVVQTDLRIFAFCEYQEDDNSEYVNINFFHRSLFFLAQVQVPCTSGCLPSVCDSLFRYRYWRVAQFDLVVFVNQNVF